MARGGRRVILLAAACLLAVGGCSAQLHDDPETTVPPSERSSFPAVHEAAIDLVVDGETVQGSWLTAALCTRTDDVYSFAAADDDTSISGEFSRGDRPELRSVVYTERAHTYLGARPGTITVEGDIYTITSRVALPDGGDPHDLTIAVSCTA